MTDQKKIELEKQALRAEYNRKTAALQEVIKPLRTASYEVDFEWNYIQKALDVYANEYGSLDLEPDFQRGHVWTPDQQRHYIENVLRGVVSSSGFLIQLNCPNWEVCDADYIGDLPKGMQCIDGLQRITAVLKFLEGEVRPFGLTPDDLSGTAFTMKGARYSFRVAIHNFKNRADLLQHYLDLNAGGTPHSNEEIQRVRKLMDEATSK